MNQRLKILMLNISLSVILIFANINQTEAATRSWHAGDLILFSSSFEGLVNTTDTYFVLNDVEELAFKKQCIYNITRVDLNDNTFSAIYTDETGTLSILNDNFGWEEFTTLQLNPNNFFIIDYDWDFSSNKTVLVSFSFGIIENWPFLEPQWDRINTYMRTSMFNNSEIIDTVSDPFEPLIHNITFSDFIGSVESFNFMGKNTLEEAKQQFTNKTRKWTFEIDLSNILMHPIYNFTLGYDIYYPYQTYIYNFEYEYTEGGIIDQVLRFKTVDCTIDYQRFESYVNQKMVLGDFKSLEANYPFFMVIPTVFLIAIILKRTKLKKGG